MLGLSTNTPSTIDIQDILYGGIAGEMPLPEILPDSQDLLLSDSKQASLSEEVEVPGTFCYSETIAASVKSQEFDIRPRVLDKISKEFILVDTTMCI